MTSARKLDLKVYAGLILFWIITPILFPNYTSQVAVMWLMVLMAVTWDMTGGQMGYNSLGNVIFFGLGMYASAVVQISMFADVAEYTASFGAMYVEFTEVQYFTGLSLGIVVGGIVATLFALLIGPFMLGLRGPYFAIGTLGVAVAMAIRTPSPSSSPWARVSSRATTTRPRLARRRTARGSSAQSTRS